MIAADLLMNGCTCECVRGLVGSVASVRIRSLPLGVFFPAKPLVLSRYISPSSRRMFFIPPCAECIAVGGAYLSKCRWAISLDALQFNLARIESTPNVSPSCASLSRRTRRREALV